MHIASYVRVQSKQSLTCQVPPHPCCILGHAAQEQDIEGAVLGW